MSTLFIADLHLQDERPELTEAFISFLRTKANDSEALYILGDLFEAWIGDDHRSTTNDRVINALKQLTDNGVLVFCMHGNRDFLLGQHFAKLTGTKLLPDIVTIKPYSQPLLIMHGDQLCLDDTEYQAFRRQVRSPQWQQYFLSKELQERLLIAKQLRATSTNATREKAMEITDVSPNEVDRVMQEQQCNCLIHGHTHRPAIHHLDNDKTRIVLGDWDSSLWYLQWDSNDQYQLVEHAITSTPVP